ncbi:hypothetical protein PHMEG_00025092 [Phytophthora megakarya]|uniref:Uncharacterized protein n=1 Tax=Phytophthora megakarya TaxID=4795 RepID=A0A225VBZ6_9STRA|nr:hypothetical protein PHMEG_00025092 [Phytophthora megakarya]
MGILSIYAKSCKTWGFSHGSVVIRSFSGVSGFKSSSENCYWMRSFVVATNIGEWIATSPMLLTAFFFILFGHSISLCKKCGSDLKQEVGSGYISLFAHLAGKHAKFKGQ